MYKRARAFVDTIRDNSDNYIEGHVLEYDNRYQRKVNGMFKLACGM